MLFLVEPEAPLISAIRKIFSQTYSLMTPLNAHTSAMLADLVLVAHAGVVSFVVLGQALFVAGGLCDWRWTRNVWIRLTHLALIAFVVMQSWAGSVCPLTLWEQALRQRAGQAGYAESFVEHWVSRLIFFNAPMWVFAVVYTLFGALVLLTWWWIPPRWSSDVQAKAL